MCRTPWCDRPAADGSRYCSTPCELKFEHIREDARDARLAEAEDHR